MPHPDRATAAGALRQTGPTRRLRPPGEGAAPSPQPSATPAGKTQRSAPHPSPRRVTRCPGCPPGNRENDAAPRPTPAQHRGRPSAAPRPAQRSTAAGPTQHRGRPNAAPGPTEFGTAFRLGGRLTRVRAAGHPHLRRGTWPAQHRGVDQRTRGTGESLPDRGSAPLAKLADPVARQPEPAGSRFVAAPRRHSAWEGRAAGVSSTTNATAQQHPQTSAAARVVQHDRPAQRHNRRRLLFDMRHLPQRPECGATKALSPLYGARTELENGVVTMAPQWHHYDRELSAWGRRNGATATTFTVGTSPEGVRSAMSEGLHPGATC
jgi:hypothetical protein